MRDRALWLLIRMFSPLVLRGSVVVVWIGAQTFVVCRERRLAPDISLAVVLLPGVLVLGMSAAAIELGTPVGRASRGVAFAGRRRSVGHAAGSRRGAADEWMTRVGAGAGVAVGSCARRAIARVW
jgi:hypothetical protein